MRSAETRALADEFEGTEAKEITLRIAADYERLAEWVEKNSTPWWYKKSSAMSALCQKRTFRRLVGYD
jgi:hypothetical protein